MKYIIILCIAGFSLTGCAGKMMFSEHNFFAPKPFLEGKPSKNAPPEYTAGWNDGCTTGNSTMVMNYYKSFYKYKFDPAMIDNAVYYKAWKDAYTYCRHYSFRYTWDPVDKNASKAADNPLCVICPNELR